jgi:hypothetical protein
LGNAHKAGCWVAARCREVDSLSQQSIERYVNIMTPTPGASSVLISSISIRQTTGMRPGVGRPWCWTTGANGHVIRLRTMQTCAKLAPPRYWGIAVFFSLRLTTPGMPSRRFSVRQGICAKFLSSWPTASRRR